MTLNEMIKSMISKECNKDKPRLLSKGEALVGDAAKKREKKTTDEIEKMRQAMYPTEKDKE